MGRKIIERHRHALNVNHVSMVGPTKKTLTGASYAIFIGATYALEVEFLVAELVGENYDNMEKDALLAACEAMATASRASLIEAMGNADA